MNTYVSETLKRLRRWLPISMLFLYGCLLAYLCYGFVDHSAPPDVPNALLTLIFISLGAFLTNLPFVFIVAVLIALVPMTNPFTAFVFSRKGIATVIVVAAIIGFLLSMTYSNVSHRAILHLDL